MRIYIKVNEKLRNNLVGIYGLSRMGIWKALNDLSNSEKSVKVRLHAMANGGKMVQEDFLPTCKTVHREDGSLVQEFRNRVIVKIDPVERAITISRGEEELERFDGVTLKTWANVLKLAQAYADGNIDNISN